MSKKILFVGNFLSGENRNYPYEELLAERLCFPGLRIIKSSPHKNKAVRFLDMLASVLGIRGSYNIACISVFSGAAFIWAEAAALLARKTQKKIILALHGGNLPDFSKRYPERMCRLLNQADVAIAPSVYLQRELQAFSKKSIRIIPNALDIPSYPYREREKLAPILVWLRAFHAIYNPMLMPRVIKILKNDFPDIKLNMIGPNKNDGSLRKTLDLAGELGIESSLSISSGISKREVPEYLNRGDIFINSTNIDNTPVSVIEAMACGLCVVSTNAGGISDLLEDEKEALLVPADNPEVMAQSIRRLLRDSDLAKKLSQNARQKAEMFDWSKVIPEWEHVFSSVN